MKVKVVFLIVLVLTCTNICCAQNIFFGIPSSVQKIETGDVIVANLPLHDLSGRFLTYDNSFGKLIDFLKHAKESGHNLQIEVNYFHGSKKLSMRYSKGLALSLEKFLKYNELGNYKVKANGADNPIFLGEDSDQYKFMNTRLELFVE